MSLSVLLEEFGEEKTEEILSTFRCEKDFDIEEFLTKSTKAIALEKANMAKTYLVYDRDYAEEKGQLLLLGYFTLAVKIFMFNENLSKEKRKKLLGMSSSATAYVPGYLIGQLAKNSDAMQRSNEKINLHELLKAAIQRIVAAQQYVGGRFVFLDCKKANKKVHERYLQEGFVDYQDIIGSDGVKYIQMIRLIK